MVQVVIFFAVLRKCVEANQFFPSGLRLVRPPGSKTVRRHARIAIREKIGHSDPACALLELDLPPIEFNRLRPALQFFGHMGDGAAFLRQFFERLVVQRRGLDHFQLALDVQHRLVKVLGRLLTATGG